MNKDQIDGRLKESGGKVKQVAGKAIDNPRLEREGRIQEASGRAQKDYGDIKNDLEKE